MKPKQIILTPQQIEVLLQALSTGKNIERNQLIFRLSIHTAYEGDEIRKLKLQDVLELNKSVVIPRTSLIMKKTEIAISIGTELQSAISAYVNTKFSYQIQNIELDHYLFPSQKRTDRPLSKQSFWQILFHASKLVGITNISKDTLRRTFGHQLYIKEIELDRIQMFLGCSSHEETRRYIGID